MSQTSSNSGPGLTADAEVEELTQMLLAWCEMIKRSEDGFTEVAGIASGFEFKHGIGDADDLARVSERRVEEHIERGSCMTGGALATELR